MVFIIALSKAGAAGKTRVIGGQVNTHTRIYAHGIHRRLRKESSKSEIRGESIYLDSWAPAGARGLKLQTSRADSCILNFISKLIYAAIEYGNT